MDQRTRLVERDQRERDAELDRRKRDALLQDRARRVEARDRLPSLPILAGLLQLRHQLGKDVVLDALVVRRAVPADAGVEIGLPHVQRIAAEAEGDVVHHPLGEHHALRATEPAEGSVRHRVGAHAPAEDAERRIEIGVVGMEHRPVDDAEREILRMPAAGVQRRVHRTDNAVPAEADRIVDPEVMPFSGHDHVVVAVEAHLARPPGLVSRECREHGPLGRLALLAAETATHAPHLYRDRALVEP
jgi:hypothetical protein